MNAECSRAFNTGTRVGLFSDAQPDTDAGNQLCAGKVKEIVGQMGLVDEVQRAGLIDVHAAAMEKRRLRREMLAGPIAHLAEVGQFAGRDQHELRTTFRFKPSGDSSLALQTAATNMLNEAVAHQEVLAKYGLSESVLTMFADLLKQYDAAIQLGANGRTAHKGATRQLEALAKELNAVIRVMDARNRQRFQSNPQLLESWISASTPLGVKRAASGTPEAGGDGDVRPAA
jgi:hypothetical protein